MEKLRQIFNDSEEACDLRLRIRSLDWEIELCDTHIKEESIGFDWISRRKKASETKNQLIRTSPELLI